MAFCCPRITEWLRLEGISVDHLAQHLCQNLVTQVCVHTAFEHPQGWRLQNLSGQPVWVLDHPHSQKVFPDAWSVPMFHFVPSASAPATGCFWEEHFCTPSPLHPSLQVLICIVEMPLSLLFRLNSPSSPSCSSQERCSSSFTIVVSLCWTLPSVTVFRGVQTWTQCSWFGLPSAERKEELPDTRAFGSFPGNLLSCWVASRMYW